MTPMTFWNSERELVLRELHAQEFPIGEIVRRMGAPSRNTIGGKLRRLGLTPVRLKPKRADKALPPKSAPAVIVRAAPVEVSAYKTFEDLGPRDCRWVTDETVLAGLYCGAPTKSAGCSWCAVHFRIVYQPGSSKLGGRDANPRTFYFSHKGA